MCPITPEVQPLGAICDTNSKGRFDLILYEDGLLAVKGTYTGVALRGAGVERTGLNVFAVSGCVLAVLVGGDHGQQSLLRRSRIQVRPRHERLIRGGMHDLTARVTRIAVFKFQLNRAIKRNER